MPQKRNCFHPRRFVLWLCRAAGTVGLLGIASATGAQTFSNPAFLDSSVNNALQQYTAVIERNSRLYNGSQFKAYEVQDYDTGQPNFLSDDASPGAIRYDGQYFTNVYLFYNLVLDKIVIENPYDNSKMELLKERVSGFSIAGHTFVRLPVDSSSKSPIQSGFYDVLYAGKTKVYARRSKEIAQKIEVGLEKKKFIERNKYFIYKEGSYFPVSNKSSVLRVLKDRKTALRTQMARNKVEFSDREFWISELARLYDESGGTP